MNYLLSALSNNCKVILVGDKDQLPSVGAGNVLHDILASEKIPYVMLTQIFRQDDKSLIVSNAHLINEGKMPILNNKSTDFFFEERQDNFDMLNTVVELVTERLPNYTKVDPINIQVLAPMRSGVCGVNRLNAELQEKINPSSIRKNEIKLDVQLFREGDKVMQICNNYERSWHKRGEDGFFAEGKGVFNGDMGTITKIDFQTGETTVYFDDDRISVYPRNEITDLQICYATTIHKSQGSEFDVVVMPIVAGAGSIVTRNLLYTGVTRAKKLVVLVGSKKNIARMVYNNFIANRYSMLCEFIKKQSKMMDIMYSE
jgi:exodeoxyribonuclease V alpha subunit